MIDSALAAQIIRDEHAAFAAVLRAMAGIVTEARRKNTRPDFGALRAMLFYVDEFAERLHHVKESRMLFARLRECTHEAHNLLAQLDRDHAQGERRLRDLEHCLTAWELLGDARRDEFEHPLGAWIDFYFEHMRLEETEVLPLAQRVFAEHDWRMLNRAFGLHRDALTGAQPEALYALLFRRIVDALPASSRPKVA